MLTDRKVACFTMGAWRQFLGAFSRYAQITTYTDLYDLYMSRLMLTNRRNHLTLKIIIGFLIWVISITWVMFLAPKLCAVSELATRQAEQYGDDIQASTVSTVNWWSVIKYSQRKHNWSFVVLMGFKPNFALMGQCMVHKNVCREHKWSFTSSMGFKPMQLCHNGSIYDPNLFVKESRMKL